MGDNNLKITLSFYDIATAFQEDVDRIISDNEKRIRRYDSGFSFPGSHTIIEENDNEYDNENDANIFVMIYWPG